MNDLWGKQREREIKRWTDKHGAQPWMFGHQAISRHLAVIIRIVSGSDDAPAAEELKINADKCLRVALSDWSHWEVSPGSAAWLSFFKLLLASLFWFYQPHLQQQQQQERPNRATQPRRTAGRLAGKRPEPQTLIWTNQHPSWDRPQAAVANSSCSLCLVVLNTDFPQKTWCFL